MHASKLLHKLIENTCGTIDKRIRATLFVAAETLTICKRLSIFGLGRALNSKAKVKHNIKRIDRLFGNSKLASQKNNIYRSTSHLLIGNNQRPVIIVDWSGLTRCGAYHFLRAAIPVGGRSLTIYDQAYALKDYASDKTHRQFLKTLQAMLPEKCRPIIITDAGFRNTWFKAVKSLGWDFIGRVRNKTKYSIDGSKKWLPIKTLYKHATTKAKCIGEVALSKSSSLVCTFYLVKQKKKFRVKRNLAGKKIQCSVSKKHEKRCREPWLLASSLATEEINALMVTKIYKKRMQIEEAFRDLKNSKNGFSLRQCRSFKLDRLNIALLIASIAMLILWIIGTAAKLKHLHYSLQANTERRWNVLSNFIIGWQILIRQEITFTKKELLNAIDIIVLCAEKL
jgi:hypothetical protein